MTSYLDCYPCMLGQALEAARMAGAGEQRQREILQVVIDVLRETSPSTKPPQISQRVHRIVREKAASDDPYREAKAESTRQALALMPWLVSMLDDAGDRLRTAARLGIAGNIIDARPGRQYNLGDAVLRALREPLAIDDGEALGAALQEVEWVLVLADNAGETVFDRLMIQAIQAPVTYAVKGSPIANDATIEDAQAAGVHQVAALVSTASDAPGTLLELCSRSFQRVYREAPLIVAKGQANYETLNKAGPRVFFLLQAKCPVLARDIGVPIGGMVLIQGRGNGTGRQHEKERPT